MRGKRKASIIAFLMVFCLILGAMPTDLATGTASKYQQALENIAEEFPAPVMGESDVKVEVSNYTFLVQRGSSYYTFDEIEAMGGLENGDYLQINFDWSIANLDQDLITGDIDYDVDLELYGISLTKFETPIDFYDNTHNQAGTFCIVEKGGKTVMSVHLLESYLKSGSDKKGTGEIYGNINVDNTENKNLVETQIGIGKNVVIKTVICEQEEGTVSIDKSSGTPVGPSSLGTYTVPFTVTVTANAYDAFITGFTDNAGNAYTGFDNIMCNGVTYASFEELQTALFTQTDADGDKGMTLGAGNTITITYDAVVGEDYFEQNSGKSLNNTFKTEYKTNLKNKKEIYDYDTPVIAKPSVSKSGSFNSDKSKITWTITVNPAPFEWTDVTGPFTDTYTESTGFTKTVSIEKSEFSGPDALGKYTCSYTTDVSSEALASAHKVELKNTVSDVSIKGHKYSGSSTLYTDGNPDGYINKDVDSAKASSDGILSWTTTIHIPDGATEASFEDTLDTSQGQHAFFKNSGDVFTVSINGVAAMQFTCTYIDAWNCYTSSQVLLTDMIESCSTNNKGYFTFKFKTDYLNTITETDDIVITYDSLITETSSAGKTYRNVSSLSYVYDGIKSTGSDDAKWYDDDPSLSVTYKNSINNKDGSFIYSLATDLKEANLKVGDVITFKEELPAGMKMNTADGIISAYIGKFANGYVINNSGVYGVENWNSHIDVTSSVSTSHVDGTNVYEYSITVTQPMLDIITSSTSLVGFIVNVGAHIENVPELTANTTYTNNVSATKESEGVKISLGKALKTDTFEIYDIVSKSCDFQYEKDIIEFTIDINPYATDFDPEADWLIGKDKMGDGLSFKTDTLKVYEVASDSTETLLTAGTDYKYTFDALNNTIQFELPDARHLKIKYSAYYILGKNEAIDPVASANVFYLLGKSKSTEDIMKKIDLSGKAKLVPYSVTSDITLYKFAEDADGNRFGLNGAAFTLYEVNYADGALSLGNKLMDKKLAADESQWKIENLYLDKLYALVENTSPAGYEKDKGIYYFILPGGSWGTVSATYASLIGSTIHVHRAGSGDPNSVNYLLYENEAGEDGKLVITKTITGVKTADLGTAAATVSFVVKNNDTGLELTYNLSDFTYDSVTKKYTLELQEKGSYTVMETVSDISGYNGVTTTYRIDSGSEVTGKSASVNVTAGNTTTVDFNNEYETAKSKLILKKTIAGITDSAELAKVVDVVKFRVVNEEISYDKTFALKTDGFTKSGYDYTKTIELPVGTYKVTETAFSVDGYNATVTYTYNATNKEGTSVDVTVAEGVDTDVTFTNTYSKQSGSIVIKKNITGIATADLSDALGIIKFTIKDSGGNVIGTYSLDSDFTKIGSQYVSSKINVSPGTYTVEETAYDVTGYKTKSISYTVVAGASGTGSSVILDVADEDEEEVTFTDEYEEAKGTLIITKTLTGPVTGAEARASIMFKVTNNKTGSSTTYSLNDFTYILGVYKLELEENVGGYTVEETVSDIAGYVTKKVSYKVDGGTETVGKSTTVTITESDNTKIVAFNNEYEVGKLIITKTVTGPVTDAQAKAAIKFKVTDSESNSKVYSLNDFTYSGGIYTLELDYKTGGYTVEESASDISGFVTKSVKYSVNGAAKVSGKGTSVTISASDSVQQVDFYDEYEEARGELVITKTITGPVTAEQAETALRFKVTNNTTMLSTVYKLSDFTLTGGVYKLTLDAAAGGYTVEETVSDITGYTTKSVKYRINGGTSVTGKSAVVTLVGEDDTQTVAFTDEYEALPCEIKLTKTISNIVDSSELAAVVAALYFEVTNNDTHVTETYYLATDFTMNSEGVYELTIPATAGGYTVTEKAYSLAGYEVTSSYRIDSGSKMNGDAATFTLVNGQSIEADFNNDYLKYPIIEITKTITGITDSDIARAEDSIVFTVTNAVTNAVLGTYKLSDMLKNSDGTYSVKFTVEPDVEYIVEETAYTVSGYAYKTTTYKLNSSAPVTDKKVSVTVPLNNKYTVAYTNEYGDLGKILITKTVDGPVDKATYESVIKFTVTDNLTNTPVIYKLTDFTYNTVKSRYELELPYLTGGYTVTESASDITGYTNTVTYKVDAGTAVTGKSASVTVTDGNTTEVDFTNTYEADMGKIIITKTVSSIVPRDTAQSDIKFKVVSINDPTDSNDYSLSDFTYNPSTRKWTLELDKKVGKYKITETAYDIDGYVTKSVKYVINSVEGDGRAGGATVTVLKDASVQADFADEYDYERGKIVITKTVEGPVTRELAENNLVFVVQSLVDSSDRTTYTLQDFTYDAVNKKWTLTIPDKRIGKYTVTETVYDIAGYVTKSVKYTVNGVQGDGTNSAAEITV
ncbi:MAG: hypothetical protein ACI4GD_08320, partial [Lachnospiraceae bacterium]